LRGQYRYQIQLQALESASLRSVIRAAIGDLKFPEGLVWTADVDPWDMM